MVVCFGVSLLMATIITLFQVLSVAEAQSCTVGFPTAVSQCTSGCVTRDIGSNTDTRIIPGMMFTCTGRVVSWRAAGVFHGGRSRNNAMLDIWRERSCQTGTYNKVATIELGTCGSGVQATSVAEMSDVYECTLPESLRVSVQPGDIVGIELARRRNDNFRLYFIDTSSGPTNYIFIGQFTTVTLSQSDSISQDQPQISFTVEMAAQTTEASTATQLPTTTIASTTELTTEQILCELTTTEQTLIELTTTEQTLIELTTTEQTLIELTTTEQTLIELTTSELTTVANTTQCGGEVPFSDSSGSAGVIVGAVVGGVVAIVLLAALALLSLALVYLTRKYKIVVREGAIERRTGMTENVNTLNMEMKGNESYIPVFRLISTDDNVAYGHHIINPTVFSTPHKSSANANVGTTDEVHNEEEEDYYVNDGGYDYI